MDDDLDAYADVIRFELFSAAAAIDAEIGEAPAEKEGERTCFFGQMDEVPFLKSHVPNWHIADRSHEIIPAERLTRAPVRSVWQAGTTACSAFAPPHLSEYAFYSAIAAIAVSRQQRPAYCSGAER